MSRFKGWNGEAILDVKIKAQAKPKGETANGITRNIIRAVNMQPECVAYRINNVGVWDAEKGVHRGGNTEKGLPDIFACVRGKMVAIEVKAGRDKLSMEQLQRRFEIERAGGIYFEARSTDDFLKFLIEIIKA